MTDFENKTIKAKYTTAWSILVSAMMISGTLGGMAMDWRTWRSDTSKAVLTLQEGYSKHETKINDLTAYKNAHVKIR